MNPLIWLVQKLHRGPACPCCGGVEPSRRFTREQMAASAGPTLSGGFVAPSTADRVVLTLEARLIDYERKVRG